MEFEEEDIMTELFELLTENKELTTEDEGQIAEFVESFDENEELTTNEQKLVKLIRAIAENEVSTTFRQKTGKDCSESEDIQVFPENIQQNVTEDSFPWKEMKPRLIRRMQIPNPPLPTFLLNLTHNPEVLWYIMRTMAFDSREKVKRSLRNKHAIRNLFWKAALAAMFGSFDASCILKHAAMRLIRNDFQSAFHLYNVATTHILRKLVYGVDKEIRKDGKVKARESLSNAEIVPITFRKYRRRNRKVCKVKALWIHYLYRNRSLIKKPYRVIDAELKDSITEIAFSDAKNRYPRKRIDVEYIVENLELSDYEDELPDYDYQVLKSDDDNKYLREDITQILESKQVPKVIDPNQNDTQTPGQKCYLEPRVKPRSYYTKCRLDNFFRHFHCPLLQEMLEQHFASGKLKEWVDEIDLPILINVIEKKDQQKPQTHYSPIDECYKVFNNVDEIVHAVFDEVAAETTYTVDPYRLEKMLYGEKYKDYCDPCSIPVEVSELIRKEEAELFEKLKNDYLAFEKEENIQRNVDKHCGERNIVEPYSERNTDEPCRERNIDEPCGERNIDKPCGERNIDEPCGEKNIDEPCGEGIVDEPCGEGIVDESCGEGIMDEPCGEGIIGEPCGERNIDVDCREINIDEIVVLKKETLMNTEEKETLMEIVEKKTAIDIGEKDTSKNIVKKETLRNTGKRKIDEHYRKKH